MPSVPAIPRLSRRAILATGLLTLLLAACGGQAPTATTAPPARTPNAGRAAGGGGRAAQAGVPSGEFAGGVGGIVALINGTTLRVRLPDATVVSVEVPDGTPIRLTVAGSVADLKVGEGVAIQGDKTGETAYTATAISALGVGSGGGPGGAARATPADGTPRAGAPAGIPGGGGTGGVPRGSGGGASPGGTAGTGGAGGAARGAANGTPGGGAAGGLTGTISAIADGTITVQTQAGPITVAIGPATVVRVPRDGTFADIHPNDIVVVQGDKTGEAVYTARMITNQGP